MTLQFQPAARKNLRLKAALIGSAGSGKTYSALLLAQHLARGRPIALIDTEHESAALYADLVPFDTLVLTDFDPLHYIEAIRAAEEAGYAVLVIDSLSHAWAGPNGVLEQVNRARASTRHQLSPWSAATLKQNLLVETILGATLHVIVTLRAKADHILSTDERGNPVVIKRTSQPIQREGLDYEFSVVFVMERSGQVTVDKSRCRDLKGGEAYRREDIRTIAGILEIWLGSRHSELVAELEEARGDAQANGASLLPLTLQQVQSMSEAELEEAIAETQALGYAAMYRR